ncbi:MAG TPA: NAD-dependent epimerase/dehydratase family protein, partial [Gammaproteobacteria bacterium]|nr:NAD-dependent epimerase/dehydratase family protein [Gammaproteobacteria bacterium]
MKILVTGASGFVGSAVMRRLVAAGHDVRVMVRPGSNRQNLEDSPVEIVEGDLRDPDSLKQAVSNCFRLFHVAADYRLWVPDPDTMYAINVRGTRDLMLAAVEAGVERIVYTSSVATLKARSDGIAATEDSVATLADMTGHYKRSKFLAEQEVQHLADKQGLPVVIVNPSTPIGPFDVKPTPTG